MINIPLSAGSANSHQRFTTRLGDNLLDFELNYLSNVDEGENVWVMNIKRKGELLVAGAVLMPSADVIGNVGAGIGHIVMTGEHPTLDNLGNANKLTWCPE